jgi:hypothetical protein
MEGDECHGPNTCTPPPNHVSPRTAYCNYFCPTSDDCAITGGYVYRGQGIPALNGWYIYADFCSGRIRAVDTVSTGPPVDLIDTGLNPVSFGETASGELLIVNYNGTINLLTLAADTDGDGDLNLEDNCSSAYNPGQEDQDNDGDGDHCDPGDADGDGYRDMDEVSFIGTEAGDPCGANGWPAELNSAGASSNKLDIQDLVSFVVPDRRLETRVGDIHFDRRWDIVPGPGAFGPDINIQDITALIAGPTAYPPMFGDLRAYGKTCPFPP